MLMWPKIFQFETPDIGNHKVSKVETYLSNAGHSLQLLVCLYKRAMLSPQLVHDL